jgi:hypothetical protein
MKQGSSDMAYMSQERKAKISPKIKQILKKYGVKGSLSVHNHSALSLTVKSGKIDFISNINRVLSDRPGGFRNDCPAKDSIQVNPYWYQEHFDGEALQFLSEILPAMNDGNHDNSDIQSDYFDVGWHVYVNIGRYNKPYNLTN